MEEKGMKKKKKLLRLFIETFYLSAFTFGGGYMIVSLMKKKFVNEYHWIEEDEMLDLVAIAQSAPGAIAVNGAIVVGYKLAGISGVIVTAIAYFYVKYRHMEGIQMVLNTLRPAVIALILTSGITILAQAFFQGSHIDLQQIKWIQGGIFIVCIYLLLRKKKDPIIVMLFAGVLNVIGSFFIS